MNWQKLIKFIKEKKMKLNKPLPVLLTLAIIFCGAVVVRAEHFGQKHPRFGMEKGFFGLRTLVQLDLSDAQKTKVSNIINKYRDERKNIQLQLSEAKKQLWSAIHAENFSEKKLRQAHRQVSPIREELAVLRARFMAELKPVLTPDQLKMLKEKRAKFSGKMKERRQFRQKMMDTWLQPSTE
jgi:Spy/CpxP family protein refolding chaperone